MRKQYVPVPSGADRSGLIESTSILAERRKLADSPGISIKPDMTKEERLTEFTLLKKRWELINTGTERGNII